MKQVFILAHAEARKRAAQAITAAPDGYQVTVSEPKRNLDQSAKLHALIGEIAEARTWAGKKWDAEVWKRLLIAAFLRTQNEAPMMLPALDNHGMEMIYKRSSDLTRRECSELIEFIEAWNLMEGMA
jgi:NinB protein